MSPSTLHQHKQTRRQVHSSHTQQQQQQQQQQAQERKRHGLHIINRSKFGKVEGSHAMEQSFNHLYAHKFSHTRRRCHLSLLSWMVVNQFINIINNNKGCYGSVHGTRKGKEEMGWGLSGESSTAARTVHTGCQSIQSSHQPSHLPLCVVRWWECTRIDQWTQT